MGGCDRVYYLYKPKWTNYSVKAPYTIPIPSKRGSRQYSHTKKEVRKENLGRKTRRRKLRYQIDFRLNCLGLEDYVSNIISAKSADFRNIYFPEGHSKNSKPILGNSVTCAGKAMPVRKIMLNVYSFSVTKVILV